MPRPIRAFDIEGHDTAQKLSILAEPRLRHQGRRARDLCRRHFLDHAGRSRRRRRARLPRQAARRRGAARRKGIEQRVHPTMVRKDSRDRAGDGRDQRGDHRRRGLEPAHAGRARAPAAWRPPRPCCPTSATSRAACDVPPFGRPAARLATRAQGADAAPRGRLLHPAAGARPAGHRRHHRQAPRRAGDFARIDRAAPSQRRSRSATGKAGAVPVILITYATTEDAVRKALAAVGRDRVISGGRR